MALRSLDPDKDFGAPKSARLIPTAAEAKNFSEDELKYVEIAKEDDAEWRLNRALKLKQDKIILDTLEAEAKEGKK